SNPQEVMAAFNSAKQDAENLALLYELQGDSGAALEIRMKWATEFALNFAVINRVGKLGKVANSLRDQELAAKGGAAKGPSLAEIDKVSAQARQDLLDEINKFPSKSKAGEYATMIGAYDPLTGKTAIGGSNTKISSDMLHVDTVKYIEDKLGVKIGEFTSFCKNKVGACAEISAADSLVRQGVDPSRIRFTEALRPREVWRKETLTDKAVVETCKNCGASWPKGS
ncbi:hypothetical protein, partial [Pseudomonas sp. PH1b]|uniref:hypothetical protein n=1 Tax=Pseudomonas sp. PH1b TaxID=1397282 RepID=UPI001C492164